MCGPYCCGVFNVTVTTTGREFITKVMGFFFGLVGLWHDFVFYEPACAAYRE